MSYLQRFRQSKKITSEDVKKAIDLYILNEKHRAMLKRKLIDGITFEELAAEFNYSLSQAKRIVYKGENIIFRETDL